MPTSFGFQATRAFLGMSRYEREVLGDKSEDFGEVSKVVLRLDRPASVQRAAERRRSQAVFAAEGSLYDSG